MTTTTRERLKKFEDDREFHLFSVDFEDYLQFIETIEKEAEERMKEKCLEIINEEDWYGPSTAQIVKIESDARNELRRELRDTISSL